MALAELALEILYITEVLRSLGHQFDFDGSDLETSDPEAYQRVHSALSDEVRHEVVDIETDSQSAHDLCHRKTVGSNSRHVERKTFKMRELQHAGRVHVKLIPTKDNGADMFTKALDNQSFARHRGDVMNLAAA